MDWLICDSGDEFLGPFFPFARGDGHYKEGRISNYYAGSIYLVGTDLLECLVKLRALPMGLEKMTQPYSAVEL